MHDLEILKEKVMAPFGLPKNTRKVSTLTGNGWKDYFHALQGTEDVQLNDVGNLEEAAVLQSVVALLRPGPHYRMDKCGAIGVCLEMWHLKMGIGCEYGGMNLDWAEYLSENIVSMLKLGSKGGICYAGPYVAHLMVKSGMLYRDKLRLYMLEEIDITEYSRKICCGGVQKHRNRTPTRTHQSMLRLGLEIFTHLNDSERPQASNAGRSKMGMRRGASIFSHRECICPITVSGGRVHEVNGMGIPHPQTEAGRNYCTGDMRHARRVELCALPMVQGSQCFVLNSTELQVPEQGGLGIRGGICGDRSDRAYFSPVEKHWVWVNGELSVVDTQPQEPLAEYMVWNDDPGFEMMTRRLAGWEKSNLPMADILYLAAKNYAKWAEWIELSRVVLEDMLVAAGVGDFGTLFETLPLVLAQYREQIETLEKVKEQTRSITTLYSEPILADGVSTHLCPEVLLQHRDYKRWCLEAKCAWEIQRYDEMHAKLTEEVRPALKNSEEELCMKSRMISKVQSQKDGHMKSLRDYQARVHEVMKEWRCKDNS